jgi:hypothetical protein
MINKFIPWDKKDKVFISPDLVAINGDGEIFSYSGGIGEEGYVDEVFHLELLEYSGKKDRNGTELYEGDIVKANLDEYIDGEECLRNLPEKTIIGVVVIRPSEGAKLLVKKIIPKSSPGITVGRTIRIKQDQDIRIGNIYTDPKLLKE